ncbi:MAG: hypothetical protein HYX72_12210 [Acidobacteria bacterium]|nr:hypothetical protein [Acidobacteriota bacterium]
MPLPNRAMRLMMLVVVGLLAVNTASAQEKPATMPSPLGAVSSCKACHPQHYQDWEQSYHSKTVVAMHAGFKKYITTQEEAKGRPLNRNELMACLGCHAPAMRFASDADFSRVAQLVKTDQREALAGLSVDCIACHSLYASGHPETKPPQGLDRQTYYGTIQNPAKSPHPTKHAPEMAKSEFCKGCHTYVTPAEMKVNADWDIVCSLTYDNWAEGPVGVRATGANKKECQTCHMEKQDGKAAITGPARKISSHRFPGWHDPAMLKKATELSVAATPKGNGAQLVVTMVNNAGHRIPDT